MNSAIVLHIINLFFAGILAGIEIAVHYGLVMPTELLSEQSQIQLRQALVLRLRILVPAFFVPTGLSGIAVAVLDRTGSGFGFRCAGMVAVIVWIAVRGIATVHVNSATLEWDAGAPPKDWRALVDRAERFHAVGVCAAVVAFGSFLAAAALKLAVH